MPIHRINEEIDKEANPLQRKISPRRNPKKQKKEKVVEEEVIAKNNFGPIADQLEEVSRMTDSELNIVCIDEKRPGIIKQYAHAILSGDISDTLRIVKEASKVLDSEDDSNDAGTTATIEDLAIGDDDEEFYVALIRQSARQLMRSNITPQEHARVMQIINTQRETLREIRSRKPKANTVLAKVLEQAASGKKTVKKVKTTTVKRKKTASKAAGATKRKKLTSNTSRGKK